MGKPSGKKKLQAAAEKVTKHKKASGSDRTPTQNNDANGFENKKVEEIDRGKNMEKPKDNKVNRGKKKRIDKKVAMEDDKKIVKEEKVMTKAVKLVFGDDIRWAQLPVDCSIGFVRQIIRDRFPSLHGVLIKYKDREGDLITIITTPELRSAETSSDPQGTFKLYLVEVTPDKEPSYELFQNEQLPIVSEGKSEEGITNSKEEWIVQFSRLFKSHVGFDTDPYLDLHELGMEIYSEAMEDTITTESSQNLFDIAGSKFQEMSALALFNLGNVHMNKARKSIVISEDNNTTTKESVSEQVQIGFEFSQKEYEKAGERYEQSTQVKPDFYEGHLALGQQQFEEAKLSWCYALGSKTDSLNPTSSSRILELYNRAEENMEKGMQMWEESEERRLNGLSLCEEHKTELEKLGLEGIVDVKDGSNDEDLEQAVNIRSQIYILWGTLLYERSVVEWKMCLGSWEECLEVSIEKFELAGASPTDITVIIKNHCSNGTALQGLSFKIDEIVQAWNEMFDTKRWQTGIPSKRKEFFCW
ncbi:unnamed protein product [Lactuca virosa]|uniref:PB1 domain-containing protein n=1 Tax=Lactuca virosa TaxID=75947 RepID=A0AAU9M4Y2_9ASTR|nr:unnamed protein product [Lactuca virosa]